MADSRQASMLALLQRLMPPPAPSTGWGAARQQIEAEAVGVMADDACLSAAEQMQLSARASLEAGTWEGDEFAWQFSVANVRDGELALVGATGQWLDAWGKTCSVPRMVGEIDAPYAIRILSTIVRPSTVNIGMAKTIDESLGITGTVVMESAEYYDAYRYNEGHRCGHGIRANWAWDITEDHKWGTFVVILPVTPTAEHRLFVPQIVAKAKAAGTRLHRVLGLSPVSTPTEPTSPSVVNLTVSDDSPTGTPTSLVVAEPYAQPEGVLLL